MIVGITIAAVPDRGALIWIVETHPDFISAFTTAAPNGAGFDSPGRRALGYGPIKKP